MGYSVFCFIFRIFKPKYQSPERAQCIFPFLKECCLFHSNTHTHTYHSLRDKFIFLHFICMRVAVYTKLLRYIYIYECLNVNNRFVCVAVKDGECLLCQCFYWFRCCFLVKLIFFVSLMLLVSFGSKHKQICCAQIQSLEFV